MHHLNSSERKRDDAERQRCQLEIKQDIGCNITYFSALLPLLIWALPILVESKRIANSKFLHLPHALYIHGWHGVKCCLVIHSTCCWQAERGVKIKRASFYDACSKSKF